jgi:quinol monooxygenase YgiN
MYARVTTFKVDPARLAELGKKVEDMRPRVRALPGLAHAYTAWRADGQGIVVALYEDKMSADRAVARMQALWGELAALVGGVPRVDTYENAEHLTG